MADNKEMTTSKDNNKREAQHEASATTETSSPFLFAVIGIILGIITGVIFTNSINSGKAPTTSSMASNSKAGPIKGDEKMPQNHPKVDEVDVEKEVQEALKFGAENPDYDSQLRVGSYLNAQAQRFKEAKPFLLKANELKPNEFEPIVQLGNLAFDQSRETNDPKLMLEAAEWYEKALKIKPDDISVRTDLGLTYHYRQPPNYEAAIAEYDKTLAVNSTHAVALFNKSRALAALKKFDEAEVLYDKLKAANTQEEVMKALRVELDKAKGSNAVPIPTH